MAKEQIKFIPLEEVWERKGIQNRMIKGKFKLSLWQRIKDKLTRKNITRTICTINMVIPMTVWPITNPIIIKISNKCDKKKISRKINIIKLKFR